MADEIQEFDITAHIRDRVRSVIVSAMPDEQIDAMIGAEHRQFTSSKNKYGHDIDSPFALMVRAEITRRIKEKVLAWLDENFDTIYEDGESKMTGELVAAFVPVAQKAMVEEMVSTALAGIRNRLSMDMR